MLHHLRLRSSRYGSPLQQTRLLIIDPTTRLNDASTLLITELLGDYDTKLDRHATQSGLPNRDRLPQTGCMEIFKEFLQDQATRNRKSVDQTERKRWFKVAVRIHVNEMQLTGTTATTHTQECDTIIESTIGVKRSPKSRGR
jgi:hypothetical protein